MNDQTETKKEKQVRRTPREVKSDALKVSIFNLSIQSAQYMRAIENEPNLRQYYLASLEIILEDLKKQIQEY